METDYTKESIILYTICGLITGLFLNSYLTSLLAIGLGYVVGQNLITIRDINQITDQQKNQAKRFANGMVIGVILSQFNFHCLFLGVALRIFTNSYDNETVKNQINIWVKQLQEKSKEIFTKSEVK